VKWHCNDLSTGHQSVHAVFTTTVLVCSVCIAKYEQHKLSTTLKHLSYTHTDRYSAKQLGKTVAARYLQYLLLHTTTSMNYQTAIGTAMYPNVLLCTFMYCHSIYDNVLLCVAIYSYMVSFALASHCALCVGSLKDTF
jgi:hypothetical protein